MNPIPEDIGEYLSYDPETGKLTWIKTNSNRAPVGSEVKSVNQGYLRLRFKGSEYRAQRVAWYLYYGEDPGNLCIDHINRDRADNRITNLRLADRQQNQQNRKALGVSYLKRDDVWVAYIALDYKKYHLGRYPCPLLAGIDYLAAKSILHPKAHV
jgi:HNH endonuclease